MYNRGIKKGIEQGLKNEVISRKIYLVYPTYAFLGDYDFEFELLSSISNEFKVPITSIQVVGSSKTGYSYFKNTPHKIGESDLDIAIIDPILFQKYCEIVMRETNGFQDLTKFNRSEESNDFFSYKEYLSKGIFRPDFMPACDAKRKWFNYFNKLSLNYNSIFSDINAGIYFSQVFFEYKQSQNIDFFKRKEL
jgi:hypothetical protein